MQVDAKTPLVFVDLETTGTSPKHHRVIEVGILRVEAGKVVAEYRQLVNPGEPVPPFITSLTGISSAMLVDAPTFDEVALEVAELLEGGLFIAHSARFDYGFLNEEFRRLKIAFSYPYLCTAKLSRSLFPQYRRHNLDSIIERFDLDAGDRHRALDDARVLWQLLQVADKKLGTQMLHEHMQEQVRVRRLPMYVKEEMITALPEDPGVYFFYGKDNDLLYIGKSRKIRTRVRSHFAKDGLSGRGQDMLSKIRRIEFQETAGELGALLLESHLIKERAPVYNVRERERCNLCLVKNSINEHGYETTTIEYADTLEPDEEKNVVAIFKTKRQAKTHLVDIAREHTLCPYLLGIERNAPCFAAQLEQCNGACEQKERHRHYNRRFKEAFATHRIKTWPYAGPVGIEERRIDGTGELFVVDNWRLLAALHFNGTEWEEFIPARFRFDYDAYKILTRELLKRRTKVVVRELSNNEQAELLGGERTVSLD